MKRKLFGIIVLMLFGSMNVNAEVYYRNNNGLPFTEYQYNAISDMMSEEIVHNLKFSEYEMLGIANMTSENHDYVVRQEETNTRATYYETNCKRIAIGKSCPGSTCAIAFTTTWKCTPAVKSYDVAGIRLSGTNFSDTSYSSSFTADGTSKNPSGSRGASNGIGYAYKVPSSGDISYAIVSANVNKTGAVYASYQHGVKSMSLSRALDFTFSATGQGGVFEWGSYDNYFDCMGGVYITLS